MDGGKPAVIEDLCQVLNILLRKQPPRPLVVGDQVSVRVQQPPGLQRPGSISRRADIDLELALRGLAGPAHQAHWVRLPSPAMPRCQGQWVAEHWTQQDLPASCPLKWRNSAYAGTGWLSMFCALLHFA